MGGFRLYFLLIAAVVASGIAALLPMAWTGSDVLESSYREYAVRDMAANANLLALALPGLPDDERLPAFTELVRVAGHRSLTRFTVVSPDGTVIADSDEDAKRMESHANRPEIRQALTGGVGSDIRLSPTFGNDWIYVAIPLSGGGALRAATSLDELNVRLAQWWKKAAAGFAVSLVVLLVLAVFVARALSKPIETAAACAGRYAQGDFSYRAPISGSAEMRWLSWSLGEMAKELDARFKLITRQKEEIRAVFENMTEGILAVDGNGTIILLNSVAEAMLGIGGDASGKSVESAVRNADLLDVVRATAAALSPLEREIEIPARQGASLAQVHSVRIREDGKDAGILLVLRDVTRLRQLEIMRRDFVANVSHELRTPVTAIQGCLETLLDGGADDPEQRTGFLEMALRNTRRMGRIIGNLLFLAGMESGKNEQAGKVGKNPVAPVLDEALSLCGEDARARGVAVDVSCEEGLTAVMSPSLVVHAVVNLLDNAIKYGAENGRISVTARKRDDATEIAVSDKGPGIPPRHHSRIFERFYRVGGQARIKEGSGLGLSLVKHIAMAHGGNITMESEIGVGSVFKLILPNA